MGYSKHVHIHGAWDWIIHELIFTIVISKPMRSILACWGIGASCQNEVSLVKARILLIVSNLIEILRGSFCHHMPIETVNIVLALTNARIGSIEGDWIIVVALIVTEVRQEWKEPCAILVLVEWAIPRVILGLRLILLKVSWTSAILFDTIDRDRLRVSWIHFSCLESPRFVHIDPNSIIVKLIVKILESLEPHISWFIIKPVNKNSNLRPYLVD